MATLRVLNFNTWDLPYSKDLSLRIPILCRILALNDRDPVAVGAISQAEFDAHVDFLRASANASASASRVGVSTGVVGAGVLASRAAGSPNAHTDSNASASASASSRASASVTPQQYHRTFSNASASAATSSSSSATTFPVPTPVPISASAPVAPAPLAAPAVPPNPNPVSASAAVSAPDTISVSVSGTTSPAGSAAASLSDAHFAATSSTGAHSSTVNVAAVNAAAVMTPPPYLRGYDIIGFEEAFMSKDREAMILAARAGGLQYAHFFESGMGFPAYPAGGSPSGLMILSRFPIIQTTFHRYALNGKPQRLLHWDWHVGKGVGLARISTPFGLVDAYVSHFVASYAVTPADYDEYMADRVAQAYECAEFIQMSRRAPLALMFCDLNSMPDSQPYAIMANLAGMTDSYGHANPHDPGHTCNTNKYADGHSRRVDYVFYAASPLPSLPDDLPGAARAMAMSGAPLGTGPAAALAQSLQRVAARPRTAGTKIEVSAEAESLLQRALGSTGVVRNTERGADLSITVSSDLCAPTLSLSSSGSANNTVAGAANTAANGGNNTPLTALSLTVSASGSGSAHQSSSPHLSALPGGFNAANGFAGGVATGFLSPGPLSPGSTASRSAAPDALVRSFAARSSRPNLSHAQWELRSAELVLDDPLCSQSFPVIRPSAHQRALALALTGASLATGEPVVTDDDDSGGSSGGAVFHLSDHCGISATFVLNVPLPDGLASPYFALSDSNSYSNSTLGISLNSGSIAASAAAAAAGLTAVSPHSGFTNAQRPAAGGGGNSGVYGALPAPSVSVLPLPLPRSGNPQAPSPALSSRSSVAPLAAGLAGASGRARRWSIVGSPLDLDLTREQEAVLRRALKTIETGMVDARARQSASRQRHLAILLIAAALVWAAWTERVGVWWLVAVLPLLTLAATAEFYLHTMFSNEEQSALSAAWHAMALRLQLGPTVSLYNIRQREHMTSAALRAGGDVGGLSAAPSSTGGSSRSLRAGLPEFADEHGHGHGYDGDAAAARALGLAPGSGSGATAAGTSTRNQDGYHYAQAAAAQAPGIFGRVINLVQMLTGVGGGRNPHHHGKNSAASASASAAAAAASTGGVGAGPAAARAGRAAAAAAETEGLLTVDVQEVSGLLSGKYRRDTKD